MQHLVAVVFFSSALENSKPDFFQVSTVRVPKLPGLLPHTLETRGSGPSHPRPPAASAPPGSKGVCPGPTAAGRRLCRWPTCSPRRPGPAGGAEPLSLRGHPQPRARGLHPAGAADPGQVPPPASGRAEQTELQLLSPFSANCYRPPWGGGTWTFSAHTHAHTEPSKLREVGI